MSHLTSRDLVSGGLVVTRLDFAAVYLKAVPVFRQSPWVSVWSTPHLFELEAPSVPPAHICVL